MTEALRPKEIMMTICDLCGEVIPEVPTEERGSLTFGYNGRKVTRSTKHVWFGWPSAHWRRNHTVEERMRPENQTRSYDFHTECILKLVEANLYAHEDGKTN
jgi:hypothetical protein